MVQGTIAEQWAEHTARLTRNLGEAQAEVLHLRAALLRSEAELEMERELRRSVEEDHEIEMQLRYEVEGHLDEQMALTAESQYRADNLAGYPKRITRCTYLRGRMAAYGERLNRWIG
jgi:hypothetical protein